MFSQVAKYFVSLRVLNIFVDLSVNSLCIIVLCVKISSAIFIVVLFTAIIMMATCLVNQIFNNLQLLQRVTLP